MLASTRASDTVRNSGAKNRPGALLDDPPDAGPELDGRVSALVPTGQRRLHAGREEPRFAR